MKNLLRFILKYHFIILFLIIESFSISLLVNQNDFQKASVVNVLKGIAGYFYQKEAGIEEYFSLRKTNLELTKENARLMNSLKSSYIRDNYDIFSVHDTVFHQKYQYISAKVVNNSVNKQFNYITIDKGLKQNVGQEMGVICSSGVVGVVDAVSKNFSVVVSVLNRDLKISAQIKKNGYFGSLSWSGEDFGHAFLNDIPQHVKIRAGDTIVTSGYSTIFPQGILIGTISNYNKAGGTFYNIKVKLAVDFKNLNHVILVRNLMKQEQQNIEKQVTQHD